MQLHTAAIITAETTTRGHPNFRSCRTRGHHSRVVYRSRAEQLLHAYVVSRFYAMLWCIQVSATGSWTRSGTRRWQLFWNLRDCIRRLRSGVNGAYIPCAASCQRGARCIGANRAASRHDCAQRDSHGCSVRICGEVRRMERCSIDTWLLRCLHGCI